MKTILLIEDNELNRDMLSRRLARKGYSIMTAVDGASGISAAQQSSPDLVLLDMSLPVIDGWQVAHELKNNSKTSAIPIIGLSAHAMDGDREKALAAGCDDYETKPIEIEVLLAKMQGLLAQ